MSAAAIPSDAPWNVCGLVIHVRPERLDALKAQIAALPGVDIQLTAPEGRLVVTAVDQGESLALDQIAVINRIPGVVSTSLVYHALDVAD